LKLEKLTWIGVRWTGGRGFFRASFKGVVWSGWLCEVGEAGACGLIGWSTEEIRTAVC
jgi:hypothetical protein